MDSNNNEISDNQNVDSTYQQQGAYQQSAVYQQPIDTNYQSTELEEPISMGHWLVCMLIGLIPCVGVVMMFVWAFGSGEKKSKSNFYKAALIFFLASTVISIIMLVAFSAMIIGTFGAMVY